MITVALRNFHILQIQLGDALHRDLIGTYLMTEGKVGQNADLPSGINALNIGGGVCFGIALFLSQLQNLGKRRALLDHLGKDKVCGAIQNAVNLINAVCGHALRQRVQNGNAAANTGLEQIVDMILPCQFQQLTAMLGYQLLVGGNNVLPGHKAPAGIVIGCVHAANGLHNHLNFTV